MGINLLNDSLYHSSKKAYLPGAYGTRAKFSLARSEDGKSGYLVQDKGAALLAYPLNGLNVSEEKAFIYPIPDPNKPAGKWVAHKYPPNWEQPLSLQFFQDDQSLPYEDIAVDRPDAETAPLTELTQGSLEEGHPSKASASKKSTGIEWHRDGHSVQGLHLFA